MKLTDNKNETITRVNKTKAQIKKKLKDQNEEHKKIKLMRALSKTQHKKKSENIR